MTKSFTLIIEQETGNEPADWDGKPAVEIELEWEGDEVPDVVFLPDGSMALKVGRYLSPGDRYCFRRPNHVLVIVNGILCEVNNMPVQGDPWRLMYERQAVQKYVPRLPTGKEP